jgi:hypothetical protein
VHNALRALCTPHPPEGERHRREHAMAPEIGGTLKKGGDSEQPLSLEC